MLFYICIWSFVYFYYYNVIDDKNTYSLIKRSRNYVSFSHSVLCTILAYFEQYQKVYNISTSYFIFDTLHILLNSFQKEIIYVYHHIILIFYLKEMLETQSEILIYLLFIGELSNWPLYITYEVIHNNSEEYIIFFWKLIQLVWFFVFRLVVYSYFLLTYNSTLCKYKIYESACSIYVLGLVWFYNNLNKNYLRIQ